MDTRQAVDEIALDFEHAFRMARLVERHQEDVFVHALGRGPASIYWDGNWPDGPKLGLEAYATYEAVEVAFNSLDLDLVIPADEHTVFAHLSKLGNIPRAEWLARQVGVEVLGESVPGR
ncbi:hypothetical protein [Streptomyces tendae]|uniref:hypothetical protein n=1 Tax=Streptomyces tendae TaxID=1932 RepID=UPI00339E3261